MAGWDGVFRSALGFSHAPGRGPTLPVGWWPVDSARPPGPPPAPTGGRPGRLREGADARVLQPAAGTAHRIDDVLVTGTPAEVPIQPVTDLLVGWGRRPVEDLQRGQHNPRG